MNNTLINLLYVAAWFVCPMIPAFILFKFLPSHAIANGPFKGLSINLTGSFAAYFILFLTISPKMYLLINATNVEIWTVSGNIVEQATKRCIHDKQQPVVIPFPNTTTVTNGHFTLSVIGQKNDNGNLYFPLLETQAHGYQSQNLPDLNLVINDHGFFKSKDTSWYINTNTKEAILKDSIQLVSENLSFNDSLHQ